MTSGLFGFLLCIGVDGGPLPSAWAGVVNGAGVLLNGGVVLLFVGIFLSLVHRRGRLPELVAKLAPSPESLARNYQKRVRPSHRLSPAGQRDPQAWQRGSDAARWLSFARAAAPRHAG